ncbi:MAG: hypothetical protein ACLFV7_03480 [Phycisphaerae bacterium]
MIGTADRDILRRLAGGVAEIASLPVQQERAELWRRFNALDPARPMVLAFPEGGWGDLVPLDSLECTGKQARQLEWGLRCRLFEHEHIGHDMPISNRLTIHGTYSDSGCGVKVHQHRTESRGAANWDPPIKSAADMEKLALPELSVDHEATARRVAEVQETFEDLLEVNARVRRLWSVGLTQDLIYLRGLMQVMMDLYDNPRLLHDLMGFLRDATAKRLDFWEANDMLWPNWLGDSYVGSGGNGHTDELPAEDFDGHTRCRDMWMLAESQEFSEVSPEQFAEFVLPYQKPLINRFALACYGCCEAVHQKLDLLTEAIPRLRRVSISPWCDRNIAARKMGKRYIFSWKPNPADVCAPKVNWVGIEQTLRDTVRIAREHGCPLEIILKDTHTFQNDPVRVGKWVQLARTVIDEQS